jgi:HflK protein
VFAALKAHGHPVERMIKDEKHGSANHEKSPRLLQALRSVFAAASRCQLSMNQESTVSSEEQLSIEQVIRLRSAALWLTILSGGAMFVAFNITARFPNALFVGMEIFLVWCFAASLIQLLFFYYEVVDRREDEYNQALAPQPKGAAGSDSPVSPHNPSLPGFARGWQWLIVAVALFVIVTEASAFRQLPPFSPEGVNLLRFATVAYLAFGCLLYFFINFASAVQSRVGDHTLNSILILLRIAFWMCIGAAGIVLLYLSTTCDVSAWMGWPLLFVALVLAAEPLVRYVLHFYQPKGLRGAPQPAGNSLILDAAFGRGRNLRDTLQSFENVAGMRLSEMWILRFIRETGLIIILGTVLLGWISTSLTAVPPGSRGVRVRLGQFDETPLSPGLHVGFPWPFEQITIIQTELIRTVSLGFDRELQGPLLWNEQHVEGEKNLLVGNGEALLSISVPILYRISDPVAYARTTSNPETALSDLAERKLLHVMGSRESFSVMIQDREPIASALHVALKKELDALRLGIEIVFVGLKDVHPPVEVAPAYQEVISAEEQKEFLVDVARAKRARTLPAARAEATKLIVKAQANYTDRVSQAEGAAARFIALAAEDKAASDLLRTQMRLKAIEVSLSKPNKTIIAIPASGVGQFYLDLRNSNEIPPP